MRELLSASQEKLALHREAWKNIYEKNSNNKKRLSSIEAKIQICTHLVDDVASQLYFTSGAMDGKSNSDESRLTPEQTKEFWIDAQPLLDNLAKEPHPKIVHQLIETFCHLLPYSPRAVFLLTVKSIESGSAAGYQYESLAVGDVVKLIQRALADHRDLFQSQDGTESECLTALLRILDLFVEAGWPAARRLTNRLEEIYR